MLKLLLFPSCPILAVVQWDLLECYVKTMFLQCRLRGQVSALKDLVCVCNYRFDHVTINGEVTFHVCHKLQGERSRNIYS